MRPRGAQNHRYLEWVGQKLDIRDNITFGTRVCRARWDKKNSVWEISFKGKPLCECALFPSVFRLYNQQT